MAPENVNGLQSFLGRVQPGDGQPQPCSGCDECAGAQLDPGVHGEPEWKEDGRGVGGWKYLPRARPFLWEKPGWSGPSSWAPPPPPQEAESTAAGARPASRAPSPAVPQWGARMAWGGTSHEGALPGLKGLFAAALPLGRVSVVAGQWCRGAGIGVGVPVPLPSTRCSPPQLPDAPDCRSDVGNRLPSSLACD